MGQASEKLFFFTYKTPFGQITIQSDDFAIRNLCLGRSLFPGNEIATELTNNCATQINEYLAGKRMAFDVPIKPIGSSFQKSVWKAAGIIPYGQVRTATEIAQALGAPNSARAVGRAVRENPMPILIPAHRIVPATGRIDTTDSGALLRLRFRELEGRFAYKP